MIDRIQIMSLIDKFTELYKPNKIIMFGSYAYGTPDEYSDLDILIITDEFNNLSFHKRIAEATEILFEIDFTVDLLVESLEEFQKAADLSGSLERKCLEQGIILYEIER